VTSILISKDSGSVKLPMYVSMSLTQLTKTIHDICKVQGSNLIHKKKLSMYCI